jgi:hypothetical protein
MIVGAAEAVACLKFAHVLAATGAMSRQAFVRRASARAAKALTNFWLPTPAV